MHTQEIQATKSNAAANEVITRRVFFKFMNFLAPDKIIKLKRRKFFSKMVKQFKDVAQEEKETKQIYNIFETHESVMYKQIKSK